jgi:hypothetical protein
VGGPSQRFSQLAELQALDLPPTNAEIAELLSREAREASYVLQRAYSRAARSSLQRIAFLNPAMPQHESAPFLRIFSD